METIESDGPSFVPGATDRADSPARWRLYQAREYFNASINEMWRRLSSWGLQRGGDIFPVPMAEVLASIDEIDFAGFRCVNRRQASAARPRRIFTLREALGVGDLDRWR